MFRERQQRVEGEEEKKQERVIQRKLARAATTLKEIKMEAIGTNKWRISGIHTDSALKIGLRLLDDKWAVDELLNFPRRTNGTPYLLKESLMKSLLAGDRCLKSMPGGDMSAMQGDVQHLSVRQLLKLCTQHLDFNPRTTNYATHAGFLQKVDSLLFEKLAEKAVGEPVPPEEKNTARVLAVDLVLIIAAASAFPPKFEWWVCWMGEEKTFFNSSNFTCIDDDDPPRGPVFEIADRSAPDPNSRGMRSNFEWLITLLADAGFSQPERTKTRAISLEAGAMGANANAPYVTAKILADSLHNLRRSDSGFV